MKFQAFYRVLHKIRLNAITKEPLPQIYEIFMYHEYRNGDFIISTNPARLNIEAIHNYLSQESYWAADIPKEIVVRSIRNSLCFGVYESSRQIGFARVISDFATFAYLADVYILSPYRGRGLAKWLMQCILAHADLQGLRRFNLVTFDAHGLYRQFGFTTPQNPETYMELRRPDIYKKT